MGVVFLSLRRTRLVTNIYFKIKIDNKNVGLVVLLCVC